MVVKFGQQVQLLESSPFGILPWVMRMSIPHGQVTLKKLYVTSYGCTTVIKF